MARFQLLRLNQMLNKTELNVYSHHIFQTIIVRSWELYRERDSHKLKPIICDILFQLVLMFDQKTLEEAELHIVFCLIW